MDRVHGATESAAFCRGSTSAGAPAPSTPRSTEVGSAGGMAGRCMARKLRCAMVGGGRGAFIGAVHRKAMALDGQFELVAGALSSDPDKARASGRDLGLRDDRNHGRWQALLDDELKRPADERIDFVVHRHAQPCALSRSRRPSPRPASTWCATSRWCTPAQQADELVRVAASSGIVFGVTYNYTGYPMVRQARDMVRAARLGEIRKVIVEYHQGWLATQLEAGGNKQAGWRTDPARSGPAGAMGDIGSHAENLAGDGHRPARSRACAPTSTASCPGRALDDDASLLLRFTRRRARRADRVADRRRLSRTTCGCASSATPARSTGGRRSRTTLVHLAHRWRRSASSRAARRGSARRRRRPRACRRATRRLSSRRSRTSTSASRPTSSTRAGQPVGRRRDYPHVRRRRARRALHREGGGVGPVGGEVDSVLMRSVRALHFQPMPDFPQ